MMLLVIRISGLVGLPGEVKETLYRLRLRRKYSAVLMKPSSENKKIRNYISFGTISDKTLIKLIKMRAQPIKKESKIDAEKVVPELEKKNLEDLGIKPFFRLHPPRGGIESKKHFGVGKGVLGENKKINELVERML